MSEISRFITVGENIHCTRIYKVGGKFVKDLGGGKAIIAYEEKGEEKQLPIPEHFMESSDWQAGKIKHTAVAIWQGLYGDEQGKKAAVDYLHYMTRRQESHKASYLDLNVDELSTDVAERGRAIAWAAGVIQEISTVPLSIDSSNLEIMRAGLEACDRSKGKPMVNSVSLERKEIIEEAARAETAVIAGASGDTSMPNTKEERVQNIDKLIPILKDAGFKDEDIFLDPLVFPVAVDPANGINMLEAVAELRRKYGDSIHFAPGLSNISFGMPNRKLLNQVFTYLCAERGCDGGIVDPLQINLEVLNSLDTGSESFIIAKAVITGEDQYGMQYIKAVREGRI